MRETTALDPINVEAGLAEAYLIGYSPNTNGSMLIAYCLERWAKGEEKHAEKTALGMGLDVTAWYRILAAGMAG